MSSALAMILVAGMTVLGDVPKEAMEEIEQGLDLRGEWEGTWHEPGVGVGIRMPVVYAHLQDDTLRMIRRSNKGVPFRVVDEGGGKCRVTAGSKPQPVIWPGIYRHDEDRLLLCVGSRGVRPLTFEPGRGEMLLILRRVKPGK